MADNIRERIGELQANVKAAHERLDTLEELIRNDLDQVKKDLKIVVAWMNRSLGWAGALLFTGTIFGFIIEKLIK